METIFSVAIAGALKAAIVLAIAALANLGWRGSSASARHLVWTIGVASALVLPVAGIAIARIDGPRIAVAMWNPTVTITADIPPQGTAASPAMAAASDESPVIEMGAPMVTQQASQVASRAEESPTTARIGLSTLAAAVVPSILSGNWARAALVVWLMGALIALLPVALAIVRVRLLARGARPVFDGRWNSIIAMTPALHHLASRVRILESETAMPMTWGVIRPTLLVPADAERWPDWQCRNILQHELAHVDRRDCLTQLMAQAACAIYWFNPLAWVAAHRMRVERELACDDRVLAAGSVPSEYAENLLEVARSLRAPSFTSSTAIAMARPSQLSGRLLAVLDSRRNRRGVSRGVLTSATVAAFASVIALASITPREADAASPHVMGIVKAAQLPSIGLVPSAASSAPQTQAVVVGGASQGDIAGHVAGSATQTRAVCWDRTSDGDKNTSTSINTDDSGSRPSWRIRHSSDNCTFELRAEGKFTLRPDLTDVESISSGGWLSIEERDGRTTRRVDIRPVGGSLEHVYYVNGNRAPYDDAARAWMARVLLDVERRTAFAAETRVPQLYRSGGLNRVLSEVSQMPSAYAKSRYFGTLLEMEVTMDAATLNEVVRRASNDLVSSDYYMSEVLGKLAKHRSANESTWRTFAEAAGRMKSDYYKSVVLKKVLNSGQLSGETVGTLLRSASGMESDYYLMDLLKSVAGKYALNDATRAYYAEALSKIESDYYRSELLRSFNKDGKWDTRTSNFVLASVSDIKSDYYRSEALRSLIRTDHVNDWATFFNAVAGIESDHYKRETLKTALDREPVTREIVAGVLSIAPRIKSDYELSEVLSSVARSYKIDDNLRPAFERAVDAIDSEYYRGSALAALRRSMTR